ncbi:peptide deformylase [Wenyingzhuangia sp. 2_MG-2023]|uniref:peptide deformylase n=1 Tax=Wenyingzhuangia sp. 2_MG-2023 TaxID=3062639 RepID=UPI0026E3B14F|nr:peptide deformylase [Wenyingzhuangia sp. 2_MG-2023]MDO6738438.1 peptide deformylase [Wenyingzhuangia sp. 2_MG-2023]MDO6803339.1 peptide deformylase [Wenyingzhuangia sp. 1_MG-2023]
MILPIVAYGDPVLRKVGQEIDKNYPDLSTLIANMWETMENANGVGLAAPQIGKSIRLFIVDATPFAEDEDLEAEEREVLATFRKVFINPKIVSEEGDEWAFEEGCLSIPDVREDVWRNETIHVTYQDESFKTHKATLNGLAARVFQHEYDHIEGVLFTDKISSLKKRLLKRKLANISIGKVGADYRMRYYNAKRR